MCCCRASLCCWLVLVDPPKDRRTRDNKMVVFFSFWIYFSRPLQAVQGTEISRTSTRKREMERERDGAPRRTSIHQRANNLFQKEDGAHLRLPQLPTPNVTIIRFSPRSAPSQLAIILATLAATLSLPKRRRPPSNKFTHDDMQMLVGHGCGV